MTERNISIDRPSGVLYGTLTYPDIATAGAALLLAGSGPTDRDGNSTLGNVEPATQKLLAAGLAERGIATLRVDKRGIGESAAAAPDEQDLRFSTYADDAKDWAARLEDETGVSGVWLIGHSEGALIAEVAAEDNPDICGLVLMAGAGRRAGDILREQLAAMLPPELKDEAFSAVAEMEHGRLVANPSKELLGLLRPSVQPYMISWLALDPGAILARLPLPTLILLGETDIQVSIADAEALSAAKPEATLMLLPGVNHVFKQAPADPTANAATYSDPDLPLAPGVSAAVADFILANTKS
ncbi:alpha/beta hydrolase [Nocardia flavorosea]|uniref:Alpha/beta hydrolase n=1 Tax=Nocardia flavorosea TaxID=53429 RepID=A0A846YTK1_9NOCA|nr:alpha/beta fold hydrolase [Nocardia flavorosea]NKY60828.1 alpha/beta hydrolase [Nocardia flavorosea]